MDYRRLYHFVDMRVDLLLLGALQAMTKHVTMCHVSCDFGVRCHCTYV